jgi:hypothetical protein
MHRALARLLAPPLVLFVLLASVASAAARSGSHPVAGTAARDQAATRIYVDASYRFVRDARANLGVDRRAIEAFVGDALGECPSAAAGSPQDQQSDEVGEEILGSMALVVYRPDDAAIERFAHTVRGLHWSDPTLTRDVGSYAHKLEQLVVLAPAPICTDVRAWAATGFQTVSAATTGFDKLYHAAEIEAEEVPLAQLARFESPREALLARHTKRLEAPLADAEAEGVAEWTRLTKGLGVLI